MSPGDVAVRPGNVEHEGIFPEDTEVIDIFAPPREDFLTSEVAALHAHSVVSRRARPCDGFTAPRHLTGRASAQTDGYRPKLERPRANTRSYRLWIKCRPQDLVRNIEPCPAFSPTLWRRRGVLS